MNKISLCQKISEHCELVKLCDINCSGPVFVRHTVETIVQWPIKMFTLKYDKYKTAYCKLRERLTTTQHWQNARARVCLHIAYVDNV